MSHYDTQDQLEAKVRELYIVNYRLRKATHGSSADYRSCRKWDGGVDGYGVRHQPVWPKIAAFVRKHRLDPVEFMGAQFYACGTRVPAPNTFYNAAALERYLEYKKKVAPDETLNLRVQILALQQALVLPLRLFGVGDRALRCVLQDTNYAMSALFRFAVAEKEGLEDVAECWRPMALEQYLRDTDVYDKVWGTFLPESIKDAVLTGVSDFDE